MNKQIMNGGASQIMNDELSMVNEKENSQLTTHNSPLVKEGYKQTEVGVIPEDWVVDELSNIGVFFKGRNIPRAELRVEGVSCVLYGEIYTKYNFVAYSLKSKTSIKIAKESFEIKKGDLLFAGSGETAEDIGKCFSYLGDEYAVAGGDIVILRPKDVFNSCFLGYILNTSGSVNQKYYMGQGSSVYHIYSSSLRNLKIPLPPTRTEQTAIATALSDMDALIEGLEKLLVKKRNIKQGAMQELLKPKEGWVTKVLGEVLKVRHGKSQKEITDKNGKYPILASGGVIGRTNNFLYDKPSVLIGRKGTIDVPQFMDSPFWTVDTLFYTEISEGYDAKFIFYMFNLIDWYSYNEASGVPSLNAKVIESIEKQFPKTIEEQQLVTKILSYMDTENELIETQLSKYKMLKTGMMQELLTGKKRLI